MIRFIPSDVGEEAAHGSAPSCVFVQSHAGPRRRKSPFSPSIDAWTGHGFWLASSAQMGDGVVHHLKELHGSQDDPRHRLHRGVVGPLVLAVGQLAANRKANCSLLCAPPGKWRSGG